MKDNFNGDGGAGRLYMAVLQTVGNRKGGVYLEEVERILGISDEQIASAINHWKDEITLKGNLCIITDSGLETLKRIEGKINIIELHKTTALLKNVMDVIFLADNGITISKIAEKCNADKDTIARIIGFLNAGKQMVEVDGINDADGICYMTEEGKREIMRIGNIISIKQG